MTGYSKQAPRLLKTDKIPPVSPFKHEQAKCVVDPKTHKKSLQCVDSVCKVHGTAAKVLYHTTVTLATSEYAVVPQVFAQSAKRAARCIICRSMMQSACSPGEVGGHRCRCRPIRISCDMANESSLPARFWMPGSKATQHCSATVNAALALHASTLIHLRLRGSLARQVHQKVL